MFGKNEVTSPFPRVSGILLVHDWWKTIQGEGPDAGIPAIFVRLAKCNLRCHFCDTEFEKGGWWGPIDLLDRVVTLAGDKIKLVVITGGEPLLQNIVPFVSACNSAGLRVSVETAGTVMCDGIEYFFNLTNRWSNLIVCSPKTPKLNEELIPLIGAFKYILGTELNADDGLPMLSTQMPGKVDPVYRPEKGSRVPIFVQPMDIQDVLANDEIQKHTAQIAMEHGYRLSLQTHKIVGLP